VAQPVGLDDFFRDPGSCLGLDHGHLSERGDGLIDFVGIAVKLAQALIHLRPAGLFLIGLGGLLGSVDNPGQRGNRAVRLAFRIEQADLGKTHIQIVAGERLALSSSSWALSNCPFCR